jgi:hypothetical protein
MTMNFHGYEKQSALRCFLSRPPGGCKRRPDETKRQNISTVTLRVLGSDEMGSLEYEK